MSFLTDSLPDPRPAARPRARARLRLAIEKERWRQRRRLHRRRWAVVGLTIILTLGVAPPGLDGEMQPLLGLADAVAASPPPLEPEPRHWYSVAETTELISVPVLLDEQMVLQFLVTAVEETWHDMGDVPRRTKTYGAPRFLSSEDADAFHSAGLAGVYREGRIEDVPIQRDQYQFAEVIVTVEADDLREALRRRVAGVGGQQMEEVHMLRLTADLIQLHAADAQTRAKILRVIADIPGIMVLANDQTVSVFIDYLDGDRPLRLMYVFDADSAHLVGEHLAVLATRTEPALMLRSTSHSLPTPLGVSES
jgi:hypothetical protein